ncbi:uncharacterized protein LOC144785447 [Lissotriton helveticus]
MSTSQRRNEVKPLFAGGSHLRAPEPVTLTTGGSMGPKWQEWLEDFEDYLEGSKVTVEKDKLIALQNLAGREISKLIKDLPAADTGTYDKVRDALNKRFLHKKNVDYERHAFHQARQGKDEAMSTFITRLRRLSRHCEFDNFSTEATIKSQIIEGCHSEFLRRRLLRKPQELDDIEELTRVYDQAEEHAATIESGRKVSNEQAHRVQDRGGGRRRSRDNHWTSRPSSRSRRSDHRRRETGRREKRPERARRCYRCGYDYPHVDVCPAMGQRCRKCGRTNHFEAMCGEYNKERRSGTGRSSRSGTRKHHIRAVHDKDTGSSSSTHSCRESHRSRWERRSPSRGSRSSSRDSEYTTHHANMIADPDQLKKYPRLHIKVGNHHTKFVMDSGASLNYIPVTEYERMRPKPTLAHAPVRVYTWMSKKPLQCLGKFPTTLAHDNVTIDAVIHVIKGPEADCLLSLPTAERLRLVEILFKVCDDQNGNIVNRFPRLFIGLGKLKDRQIHLHVNKHIRPVAQHPRRVPFHLQKAVEEEINDLLSADIIERTDGPTPWVSPVVVVPKKGTTSKVRLCVDTEYPTLR